MDQQKHPLYLPRYWYETYMIKVVVVHFAAELCVLHREKVAGAGKEEVPHEVPDHLLVQKPVVDVLPVRVLKQQVVGVGGSRPLFRRSLKHTKNSVGKQKSAEICVKF